MPNIEFDQVTMTTRRREAANTFTHFYRQKKALQPIYLCIKEKLQTYRLRKDSISAAQKQKILQEIQQLDRSYTKSIQRFQAKAKMIRQRKLVVMQSSAFNDMIQTHVSTSNYHLIDYHHPNFVQHLFGAFELSLINMNDMISIKSIYDALLCFHHGHLPAEPAKSLERNQLPEGQFQAQSIEYWTRNHSQKLQKALSSTEHPEKYHYYTIGLDEIYTDYLVFEMLWQNFRPYYFRELLFAYINRKGPEFRRVLIAARNYLHTYAPCYKMELLRQLFGERPPHLEPKEKDSILFFIAVEQLDTQMPSILIIPHGKHLIEFIIPSMDYFNLIQGILHGQEAVYPCGVVGKQSPRLIRAFDEIPSIPPGQALTEAQKTLVRLYPIAQTFETSRRPVEITYPNIPYEDNPHDFRPYDFMLLWHDLFHAWRSGSNFKKIIRELRLLHDEKLGYSSHQHRGMSPTIWNLTDMDTSAGLLYRNKVTLDSFFSSFKLFIEQMVFKFYDIHHPENYLFLFDLVKNPSRWEPLPFIHQIETAGALLERFPDVEFEKFYNTYLDVNAYIQEHGDACFFEVYLSCILKPTHPFEIKVLQALSDEICHTLFTWGPYEITFQDAFYHQGLESLIFPRSLKKSLGDEKKFLMYLSVYLQLNHGLDIPQEEFLTYFTTLGEAGFHLLSRLNHTNLEAFIIILFAKDEIIPKIFFQIIIEQDLLTVLWSQLLTFPENPILWQLACLQESHYTLQPQHIDYLVDVYQKAMKQCLPTHILEFTLLESPEGFAQLIRQEKPKWLESFIHASKHFPMDVKRHIFYNDFNEIYYIIKHSIPLNEDDILKLIQKYPVATQSLLKTLHNQEIFVEKVLLQYFPSLHASFIDEILQEINLEIILKTAAQFRDNEEQFVLKITLHLPPSPELNELLLEMQKLHPDRQYFKISTLSFMTRNQMYRLHKTHASEMDYRSSSPSFFNFFLISRSDTPLTAPHLDAENAAQNQSSSPLCVPWLSFNK